MENQKEPTGAKNQSSGHDEKEPKMMPVWEHEKEKKQLEKAFEEKFNKQAEDLNKKFENLQSSLNNSQNKPESSDEIEAIVRDNNLNETEKKVVFEIFDKATQKVRKEFDSKFGNIEKTTSHLQKENQFSNEFNKDVLPKMKEKYPDLPMSELEKTRQDFKDLFLSGKYGEASVDEVFQLYELQGNIQNPEFGEEGKAGASRQSKSIDYTNITEEQFNQLSEEEQDKVIELKKANG